MPVNTVLPPLQLFTGADGQPLEGGYIFIGEPGFEARSTPKASFFDVGLTVPTGTATGAAVRTMAGYPIRNGQPATLYVDGDHSITVTDKNLRVVFAMLNRTFELGAPTSAVSPVVAPDGNLLGVGFGWIGETNTGRIRSAPGTEQDVVLGVPVAQRTNAGTEFVQPITGAGVLRLRAADRIINGAFDIWQRGTSGTGNGYTAADMWPNLFSGGTVTQSRQSFAVGDLMGQNAPAYFLRQAVTGQSLASHFANTTQRIEGVGTYSGQTITVMGWAKRGSGTGNMAIDLRQSFGTGGSPSAAVLVPPVSVTLTGSWAPFVAVFAVPSIAGKTLGSNENDCLEVAFWTSAGTDFNARTNSLGVQTVGVDLWGVHVRMGTFTTAEVADYLAPPVADALLACQRYCAIVHVHAQSAAVGFAIVPWYAPVEMRALPTLTVTASGTPTNAIPSADIVTHKLGGYFQIQATVGGGSQIGRVYRVEANL